MPRAVDDLILEMSLNNKKVLTALNQVNKSIIKTEKTTKKTGKSNDKALKGMKKNWLGITAVIGGTIIALRKSLTLFAEQDRAERALTATFNKLGVAGEEATKKFTEFASAQQQITKFGDETIISAASLLQSLSGLTEQGLEEATLATLNLASAQKIDLESAARLVGKTIGTTTDALSRYIGESGLKGVTDSSQRAAILVGKLNEKFGGFAAEEGKSAVGQLANFSNALGDVQEEIGRAVLPALTPFLSLVAKLSVAFGKLPQGIRTTAVAVVGLSTALALAVKFIGISVSSAGAFGLVLLGIAAGFKAVQIAIDANNKSVRGWLEVTSELGLEKAKSDLIEYGNQWDTFDFTAKKTVAGFQAMKKSLEDLTAGVDEGEISVEEFEKSISKLDEELTGFSVFDVKGLIELTTQITNTEKAIETFSQSQQKQQDIANSLMQQELSNKTSLDALDESNKKKLLQRQIEVAEATGLQREAELLKQQQDVENRLALLIQEKELFNGIESEFRLQKEILEQQHQDILNEQRENTLERDRQRNEFTTQIFGTTFENISLANQILVEKLRNSQNALWAELERRVSNASINIVSEYGAGIGKMIATGEVFRKNFGDFINEIIAKVIELGVQLAVVEGVKALFTGGTSLIGGLLGFAGGTDSAPGGPAIVGERGPEIMNVPKGAQIIPNHKIGNLSKFASLPHFANGTGGDTISTTTTEGSLSIETVNVQANSPEELVDALTGVADNLGVKLFKR